jgi:iron complex transport system substrate-binding protein
MIRFPYDGRDPYYTLYEAFEKAAQIFQRQAQYDAWVDLKESVYADVRSRVPDDAPTVAAFNFGFDVEGGQFYAANIDAPRNDARTFRLLGVDNAFEGDSYVPFKPIGHEALLEIDPDYIGVIGQLSYVDNETFQATIEAAQTHETLGQLTAVENGNFLRTGGQYMGPIVDLFSTEALAMQLYPDEFGQWPGSIEDVPAENQLFDRAQVAAIINDDY